MRPARSKCRSAIKTAGYFANVSVGSVVGRRPRRVDAGAEEKGKGEGRDKCSTGCWCSFPSRPGCTIFGPICTRSSFIAAAIAIIPLAGWLGRATEHIAEKTGEGIGGLLNATFGNAAEMIIAIVAMQRGLHDVVKASLTGIDHRQRAAGDGRLRFSPAA